MADIVFEIVGDPEIAFDIDSGGASLSAEFDNPYVGGMWPLYEGEYNIRPQPYIDTVLPTANKSMADDVTVQKIPYYETTNLAGGYTAIIGD